MIHRKVRSKMTAHHVTLIDCEKVFPDVFLHLEKIIYNPVLPVVLPVVLPGSTSDLRNVPVGLSYFRKKTNMLSS